MNATISIEKKSRQPSGRSKYPKTLKEFLEWKPEDGYKYEWNNGILEKTPKMITPQTLYLVDNLSNLFEKLKPKLAKKGRLFSEPQANTSKTQVRVPDLAYYSAKQIREGAEGSLPVPSFAIELISTHDKYLKVIGKLEEFFKAGVQVVWLVDPVFIKVNVYTSPEKVTICKGTDLCSAEPVIPGYVISVDDIFKKP